MLTCPIKRIKADQRVTVSSKRVLVFIKKLNACCDGAERFGFFVIACDNLIFRKFPVSQISPFSCVINPLTPRGTRCFYSSQVSPPYITNGGVPSDDAACIERTYYIARDSAVTHFTNNVFGLVVN